MNKRLSIAAVAVAAALGCGLLAGCSSSHEMISAGKQCTDCHEEKTTYSDVSPDAVKDIQKVTSPVTYSTSADTVSVCKVVFISADGSKYVPQQSKQVRASNGSVTVDLESGFWALCTGSDGKASRQLFYVE